MDVGVIVLEEGDQDIDLRTGISSSFPLKESLLIMVDLQDNAGKERDHTVIQTEGSDFSSDSERIYADRKEIDWGSRHNNTYDRLQRRVRDIQKPKFQRLGKRACHLFPPFLSDESRILVDKLRYDRTGDVTMPTQQP